MLDLSLSLTLIPWCATLLALLIATVTDLRVREVPDWLSYTLIAFGIGFAIIVSLDQHSWHPTVFSLAGLLVCMSVSYLMYYAGQWGGGDAKLLMGIGSVIGLNIFSILHLGRFTVPFLLDFFLNTLFAGAVYGLIWTSVLGIKKWKVFLPTYKGFLQIRLVKIVRFCTLASTIILLILTIIVPSVRVLALVLGIIIYCFFYLWIFVKAIEKSCMVKEISPERLTEGDWILHDIVVDGERIAGPKDLGISKDQIAQLIILKKKKKVMSVLIKEGVPFVPSFLIAFLLASFFPSWYLFLF